MEPGPVPPHERRWRHPSELGPPPHEPTTPSGRALLIVSAAMGFVVIGVLAVAVTPGRSNTPSAVESSSSSRPVTAFEVGIVSVAQPLTGGATSSQAADGGSPIVTPLGDGQLAVTTRDAVNELGATMTAKLPTGQTVEIVVVSIDEVTGVAMVSLPEPARGYRLADHPPGPDETVLVAGVDATLVPIRDVSGLDVEEGAPVIDSDGELVGLCSDDDQGTEVILGPVPTSIPAAPPTSDATFEVTGSGSSVAPDGGATTAPD